MPVPIIAAAVAAHLAAHGAFAGGLIASHVIAGHFAGHIAAQAALHATLHGGVHIVGSGHMAHQMALGHHIAKVGHPERLAKDHHFGHEHLAEPVREIHAPRGYPHHVSVPGNEGGRAPVIVRGGDGFSPDLLTAAAIGAGAVVVVEHAAHHHEHK